MSKLVTDPGPPSATARLSRACAIAYRLSGPEWLLGCRTDADSAAATLERARHA